ncbi:C-type lectin domain family 4 member M-like [Thunnus maccoyii]|uniref:C-type lectin domain family 4 member M-like n=1 Tax=Thunnus maccoyii TaxID=8240 RepID=UPI001C4CE910|nr:C-type lectin domain family 4 member M-like [Thunnus maccoyii]
MEGSNHTYQYLLEVIIDNENLKRHNSSLTVQMNNLTEAYTVLSSNITNVSRENQQLKAENQWLKAENQRLKAENQRLKAENQSTIIPTPILTVTPQNWTTLTTGQWNQFQWTLNGFYTRKKRNCEPCQTGWFHFQASCYAIGNQSTWEEARDDCRSKKADLVVIESPDEQEFISNITRAGLGTSGYWIGLRAEAGSWQWVNGSDLTEDFWMQQPADGHQCVISVQESNGLKAVSCDVKNGWICEKKALSKF